MFKIVSRFSRRWQKIKNNKNDALIKKIHEVFIIRHRFNDSPSLEIFEMYGLRASVQGINLRLFPVIDEL